MPARLLDLTRLMRRVGRVLTGVDRVELVYLRAVLRDEVPAFALIRSPIGYILLDRSGMTALEPELAGAGTPSRAWRVARRAAVARVPPVLLGWALRRMPAGFVYLNIGHSNLTPRVLRTVKAQPGARVTVFVHDVVPLEFPQFQRDGTAPKFAAMIERVRQHADLVIYNSQDTRSKAEAHLGRQLSSIVAHLGTDRVDPAPADIPRDLPHKRPYFMAIGTIEPRKNHRFLLDIWTELGPDAPGLILAGHRGWGNADVFARLDALPNDGPVREVAGLSDGAIAALTQQSAGVLFPTLAEGFGLPVAEAAALQVPVMVNDLRVFREFMGDIPIYASVSDRYLWINKIKELAEAGSDASKPKQFKPPNWEDHFKTVLRLT